MASANALRTASRPRSACAAVTTQQIECSLEPCEIIVTDTPAACSAANMRSAVPGTPIRPAPLSSSTAMLRTTLRPLSGESLADGWPWLDALSAAMRVPGAVGLRELRIRIGSPACIAGAIVCGCSTFAPK